MFTILLHFAVMGWVLHFNPLIPKFPFVCLHFRTFRHLYKKNIFRFILYKPWIFNLLIPYDSKHFPKFVVGQPPVGFLKPLWMHALALFSHSPEISNVRCFCPLGALFYFHSGSVFSFFFIVHMFFFFIHVTLISLHFNVIFLAWSFWFLFDFVSSCNFLSLFSSFPFVSSLSSSSRTSFLVILPVPPCVQFCPFVSGFSFVLILLRKWQAGATMLAF